LDASTRDLRSIFLVTFRFQNAIGCPMTYGSMPVCPRYAAALSPYGPAPTITTSLSLMCLPLRGWPLGVADSGPPRLQKDVVGPNPIVERLVDANERLTFWIVEVDRVRRSERIVVLSHELGLRVLERASHVEVFSYSHKQRPRVLGQAANQV